MNPPSGRCRSAHSGPNSSAAGHPRSAGKPDMPSRRSASSRHSCSGEDTSPGSRQAMPTIAIGSSATAAACTITARAAPPPSRSPRKAASAAGVGWSNTSVAGSVAPVARARLLRSSTEVSESKPRPVNGWSTGTPAAESRPRTPLTCVRTSSSSAAARPASSSPASRAAKPPAAAADSSAASPAARRRPCGISALSSGGTGPPASWTRRPGRLSRLGTSSGRPAAPAASKSARPVVSSSGTAVRSRRRRSVSESRAPMPESGPHRPQAIDTPGRPCAVRQAAKASVNVLPAA
ncbi:Uncharacterised protein [Mycobacterium tuberculosis]|nr:Uncharacterised protein [Mycobacterium tuberculosis]